MIMRVSFDAQIFCSQQYGGISRYYSSIARSMRGLAVPARIVAPLYINAYLGSLPSGLVYGVRLPAMSSMHPALRAASIGCGWLHDCVTRPEIIHRTYYYPVPDAPRSARTVITVYDMIHEKYPDGFLPTDPIAAWKAQAVARADHIICISHQTRNDLVELCGVDPARTSVTHLGFDALADLPGSASAAEFRVRLLGADVPYLLYVGARTRYKNFLGLLRAYAASTELVAGFRIVCFGGGPFTTEELAAQSSLGIAGRITQTGGSDNILADCYRHAALFVYPSLYEGFGIPPLEAMSLDCPVACSNSSSLPEVVGDAAMLFDPTDVDSIRHSIEAAVGSATARQQLVASGRKRHMLFSWERCARETLAVYARLLERRT